MSDQDNNNNDGDSYDRKTLFIAAGLFFGFCLAAFFLPSIMTAVGTSNPYLTAGLIAAFLVLPFVGLWWRGHSKRKN